jgi:hypothetical protein
MDAREGEDSLPQQAPILLGPEDAPMVRTELASRGLQGHSRGRQAGLRVPMVGPKDSISACENQAAGAGLGAEGTSALGTSWSP